MINQVVLSLNYCYLRTGWPGKS